VLSVSRRFFLLRWEARPIWSLRLSCGSWCRGEWQECCIM